MVDGSDSDKAWSKAPALNAESMDVLNKHGGKWVNVTLKSVHTDTHIYFLAIWDDKTKDDVAHKPWVWDEPKKSYVEGSDREDMFSISFELRGEFHYDMLAPVDAAWDIWHWKAVRTNPQGYAMDRMHIYSTSKPEYKAKEFRSRSGKPLWMARPEDKGKTVEGKVPAPKEFKGDKVNQYVNSIPDGSAADVQAKGSWADGKWILEFARALKTGNDDDTQFDIARSYLMAVSTHDHTGDMDRASIAIKLKFVSEK
jgi:hypothetical protein